MATETCMRTLLHAADVAVEPSNDFLDDLAALGRKDHVPATIDIEGSARDRNSHACLPTKTLATNLAHPILEVLIRVGAIGQAARRSREASFARSSQSLTFPTRRSVSPSNWRAGLVSLCGSLRGVLS